jgi:hypothetical protein
MRLSIIPMTIAYILNFAMATIVMIILGLKNQYTIVAELGVIISIIYSLVYFFSSNARNIIITNRDHKLLKQILFFRIVISVLIVLPFLLVLHYFKPHNFLLIILIFIQILSAWLNEIIFTKLEIEKKLYVFKYYNFIIIILLLILIRTDSIKITLSLILLLNIIMQFIFFQDFKLIFKNKIFYLLKTNIFSYAFISGATSILVNLSWRIFIYNSYNENISGILFTSFAIASAPGTIFMLMAPSFLKMKIFTNKYMLILVTLILSNLLFISLNLTLFRIYHLDFDLNYCLIISLSGTVFMISGLFLRQYIFSKKISFQKKIFKYDIFCFFLIFLTVPTIILLEKNFIIYSFFISSIITLICYLYIFFIIKKNNIVI